MRKTQKVAIVGGTVAVLFAGGVAYAAWTSTGSGTGTATAGDATVLTVTGSDATGLYPTQSVPGTVTVSNPGSYGIKLSSVVFNSADSDTSGCTGSVVSAADLTGLTDVIPAGGHVDKAVVISMTNAAEQACEGAEFTLHYTATGASN